MKILLIDTCGERGSVALADAEAAVCDAMSAALPGRNASERLVATIRDVTAQAGMALRELGVIAVVNGPGAFTGERVGVSAAKGLSEALGIPLIAISRLAVLAEVAGSGRIAAALDAGRGEVYCGVYQGSHCEREAILNRDEVLLAVAGKRRSVVVCEPDIAEMFAELSPRVVHAPTALDALPIALRRIAAGEFDDPRTLDANYLRRTDAEIFANPNSLGRHNEGL